MRSKHAPKRGPHGELYCEGCIEDMTLFYTKVFPIAAVVVLVALATFALVRLVF